MPEKGSNPEATAQWQAPNKNRRKPGAREDIEFLYVAGLVHSAVRGGSLHGLNTKLAIANSPELQGLVIKHAPALLSALEALSQERR